MKATYQIQAWCLRPFISCIEVEAETPQQAIAVARMEKMQLLDAAEECSGDYPWNEFAAYDENGKELRFERDEPPPLRETVELIINAAGDLDAAIDGVTDQFDSERAALDRAIQIARKAIATSKSAQTSGVAV